MAWFSDRDRRQNEGDPTGSRATRRDGWEPTRGAMSHDDDRPRRPREDEHDDDRYSSRSRDVSWGRDRDANDEVRASGRDDRYRDEGRVVEERTYRARDRDDGSPDRVRRFDRGDDRYYRGQGYDRDNAERNQPMDDSDYGVTDRERERNFRMPSGRDSERVREMRTHGLDYGDRSPQRQQTGEYSSYLDSDRFSNQDLGDQYGRSGDRNRRENNHGGNREARGEGFAAMGGQSWRASERDSGPHAGRGPRGWQRSDERIHDEVCEALWRHGTVDASDIEVKVEGGEVTLDGFVRTRHEKRLAEDQADRIEGVRDIHNRLRVGSGGPRDSDRTYSPTEAATSVTTVVGGKAPEHARGTSSPMGGTNVYEGMQVFSSDDEDLGTVKQARESDFLLDRSMSFDVFVPLDLVASSGDGRVTLSVTKDQLGEMDLQKPAMDDWGTGVESSKTTGTVST